MTVDKKVLKAVHSNTKVTVANLNVTTNVLIRENKGRVGLTFREEDF